MTIKTAAGTVAALAIGMAAASTAALAQWYPDWDSRSPNYQQYLQKQRAEFDERQRKEQEKSKQLAEEMYGPKPDARTSQERAREGAQRRDQDQRDAKNRAGIGGAWETTWAGGQALLDLTQKGAAVTGTYSGTNEGKVKGTVAGNVLTGNWTGTANDSGGVVLKFSADGKSFTGTWGMGASKTDGGPWAGTRK